MRKMIAGLGSLVLGLSYVPTALAQQAAPPAEAQPQPSYPAPGPETAPSPQAAPAGAAPAPPGGAATAPPPSWVYSYPTGQWVYTTDRGWIWVPAGSTTTLVEGVPYAYLYTPAYGWTWYISPWGWGPYRYGAWVSHPWRPVGWRGGWVAHPHVVVRLGGAHFHR